MGKLYRRPFSANASGALKTSPVRRRRAAGGLPGAVRVQHQHSTLDDVSAIPFATTQNKGEAEARSRPRSTQSEDAEIAAFEATFGLTSGGAFRSKNGLIAHPTTTTRGSHNTSGFELVFRDARGLGVRCERRSGLHWRECGSEAQLDREVFFDNFIRQAAAAAPATTTPDSAAAAPSNLALHSHHIRELQVESSNINARSPLPSSYRLRSPHRRQSVLSDAALSANSEEGEQVILDAFRPNSAFSFTVDRGAPMLQRRASSLTRQRGSILKDKSKGKPAAAALAVGGNNPCATPPVSIDHLLAIKSVERRFTLRADTSEATGRCRSRSDAAPLAQQVFQSIPFVVSEACVLTLRDAVSMLHRPRAPLLVKWLLEVASQVCELHRIGVNHNFIRLDTVAIVRAGASEEQAPQLTSSGPRSASETLLAKLFDLSLATITSPEAIRAASSFTVTEQRRDPTSSPLHRLPHEHLPVKGPWELLPPEWFKAHGMACFHGASSSGSAAAAAAAAAARPSASGSRNPSPRSALHAPGASARSLEDAILGTASGVSADQDIAAAQRQVALAGLTLRKLLLEPLLPDASGDAFQLGRLIEVALAPDSFAYSSLLQAPGMAQGLPHMSFEEKLRSLRVAEHIEQVSEVGELEWRHLVAVSTRADAALRWSVEDIRAHPFFWPAATKVAFVSLFVQLTCAQQQRQNVAKTATPSKDDISFSSAAGGFASAPGVEGGRTSGGSGGASSGQLRVPSGNSTAAQMLQRKHTAKSGTALPSHASTGIAALRSPTVVLRPGGAATASTGSPMKARLRASALSPALQLWVSSNRQWLHEANDWYEAICHENAEGIRYDYDNITHDMLHFFLNVYDHCLRHATRSICGGDASAFATAFLHQRFAGLLLELATRATLNDRDAEQLASLIEHQLATAPSASDPRAAPLTTIRRFVQCMRREPPRDVELAAAMLHRPYDDAGDVGAPGALGDQDAKPLGQKKCSDSVHGDRRDDADDAASFSSVLTRKSSRRRSFKVTRTDDLRNFWL